MDYFESKRVWEIGSINEARTVMGRAPISVRLVETNKGDDANPNIRTRSVAREIKPAGQDAIFAPTPPLESLRTILSMATTKFEGGEGLQPCWDPASNNRTQLLMVDIRRAYFNAKTSDEYPTYVELPKEMNAPPGTCGLLRRHMYATQRAAEGWQDEYSSKMVEAGFIQGIASPCVFHHPTRSIVCAVHGDVFTAAGPKPDLAWFEATLKKSYELTVGGRLKLGPNDDKETTGLNGVILWTETGMECETDSRQVEKLITELELDRDKVKGVVTPGVKVQSHQALSETELPESEHTRFRGLLARANFLAADRPDIVYSAENSADSCPSLPSSLFRL